MARNTEFEFYIQTLFEQALDKEIILDFPAEQYSIQFYQKFYWDLDNFRKFVYRNRIKSFYLNLANKIENVEVARKHRKIILRKKSDARKTLLLSLRNSNFNKKLKRQYDGRESCG